MPSKFDKLIKSFTTSIEKSTKECSSEAEKFRLFVMDSSAVFKKIISSSTFSVSLKMVRVSELYRLIVHIQFLSLSGLYRNAFDSIRYVLESSVQSVYIDSRHPRSGLRTRIEILKEVEDKREYHAVRLIDKLEIDHKETLRKEYKKLSRIIHPSHRTVIDIAHDMGADKGFPVVVNCKEISNIYESLKIMLDIVFFLYLSYASNNLKEQMKKDSELIKYCETYSLRLMSKVLKA